MLNTRGRLQSWIALALFIITIAGLGLVIQRHYGDRFGKRSVYIAEFDGVSGLMVGTPVKLNGVVVGSVRSIHLKLQHNFTVDVAFAVSSDIRLPDDSRAAIVSESLFGSPILALYPGMSDTLLQEGGLIVDTQPPVQMHELLQKLFFNAPDAGNDGGSGVDKDDESDKEPPKKDGDKEANLDTEQDACQLASLQMDQKQALNCGGWV